MHMVENTQKFFGYAALIETEGVVSRTTAAALGGLDRNFPSLVDILLNLAYFMDGAEDSEADDYPIRFLASLSYVQAPYTFWAAYDLGKRGYYIEAVMMVRHLLEVFVRLRYFQSKPTEISDHINGDKRVSFLDMFESIAPGFYRPYYGRLLSGFAHGPLGPALWRYDHGLDGKGRPRMGCQFDENQATFVFNNLAVILFGFFEYFKEFFPVSGISAETLLIEDLEEAKGWLDGHMRTHRRDFPQSEEWYVHIEKIVRLEAGT